MVETNINKEVDFKRGIIKHEEDLIVRLGLDLGYGKVKAVIEDKHRYRIFTFDSNIEKGEGFIDESYLEVKGDKYIFGTEAKPIIRLNKTTKDDELHRILMYKAMTDVSKFLGVKNIKFRIVVTIPVHDYQRDKGLNQIKVLSKAKDIEVKDCKNTYNFKIDSINGVPETFAACLALSKNTDGINLKEDKIIFCDIGNYNTTFGLVDGAPLIKTLEALTKGVDHAKHELMEISKPFKDEWRIESVRDMERYLKKADEESINKILQNKLNDTLFEEMMTIMKTRLQLDTRGAKIAFLGGGSVLFKDFLDKKFEKYDKVFLKDADTLSARGALRRAISLYQNTDVEPVSKI